MEDLSIPPIAPLEGSLQPEFPLVDEAESYADELTSPRAGLVRPSGSQTSPPHERPRETYSFNVYIDESGDEGFGTAEGTSDWLVLSAAVVRAERDWVTAQLVDEIKRRLEMPPKPQLHSKRLKHEQRVYVCNRLATEPLRCISVVIDKRSIRKPETFRQASRLYFYGVRMLLERVSWLCQYFYEAPGPGDGRAWICFSDRATMVYEDLRQYLIKLRDEHSTRIVWDHIDPYLVESLTPGKRPGLQIADIFASATFKAVQPNKFGLTEPRYLRELRPLLYRRRGVLFGNGLKLWPGDVDPSVLQSLKDLR